MKDYQRMESFDKTKEKLEEEGYTAQAYTISIFKANVMAFVIAVPLALLCSVLFFSLHAGQSFVFSFSDPFLFLLFWIISMALNEILHGLAWSFYSKKGWKSIHIGVMWRKLTPYCCCLEPLRFGPYMLGCLMPLILLGLGTFAVAVFTGSLLWLVVSVVNIISTGGDLTIALALRKHKNAWIVDHPTECGFWAFSKNK